MPTKPDFAAEAEHHERELILLNMGYYIALEKLSSDFDLPIPALNWIKQELFLMQGGSLPLRHVEVPIDDDLPY